LARARINVSTTRGEFCIRTEWQCGTLLYEVFLNSGLIVATGFDMLSLNEEEAVEATSAAALMERVNTHKMQPIYRRFLLQTGHQETGISYALFWLKERKKICDGFSPGFDEVKTNAATPRGGRQDRKSHS